MLTLREFRPEDASGEPAIVREIIEDGDPIAGVTVEQDGAVVAYGGVRLIAGKSWAFLNLTDEGARKPFLLHRMTVASILALGRAGVETIHTFADVSKPRAEEWLLRLGFRKMQHHEKDETILAAEAQTGHQAWVLGG